MVKFIVPVSYTILFRCRHLSYLYFDINLPRVQMERRPEACGTCCPVSRSNSLYRHPGHSRLLWPVSAEISCQFMSCLWSQGDTKIKIVWLHCFVCSWNIKDNDIMKILTHYCSVALSSLGLGCIFKLDLPG